MKLGSESAKLRSQHNALVKVANAVLGGDPTPGGPPKGKANDVTAGATTIEGAVAAMTNMLKF